MLTLRLAWGPRGQGPVASATFAETLIRPCLQYELLLLVTVRKQNRQTRTERNSNTKKHTV